MSNMSNITSQNFINSQTSDNPGDLNETNFYEKLDEQIYDYVTQVESLVKSVAPEREILGMLL